MLFSLTQPEQILNTATGQPITALIYHATNNRGVTVSFTLALAVCFINGTSGCITSGSRLLWAMARDNGAPFSSQQVNILPQFK